MNNIHSPSCHRKVIQCKWKWQIGTIFPWFLWCVLLLGPHLKCWVAHLSSYFHGPCSVVGAVVSCANSLLQASLSSLQLLGVLEAEGSQLSPRMETVMQKRAASPNSYISPGRMERKPASNDSLVGGKGLTPLLQLGLLHSRVTLVPTGDAHRISRGICWKYITFHFSLSQSSCFPHFLQVVGVAPENTPQ